MAGKIKKYEDLRIWKEGHQLTIEVYRLTSKFPQEEKFGIISQLRRSASSIPANIVEGFYRNTTKELIQFLYNSRGSTGEVIYFLTLSKDLNIIPATKYKEIRDRYENLARSINALINSLKK